MTTCRAFVRVQHVVFIKMLFPRNSHDINYMATTVPRCEKFHLEKSAFSFTIGSYHLHWNMRPIK